MSEENKVSSGGTSGGISRAKGGEIGSGCGGGGSGCGRIDDSIHGVGMRVRKVELHGNEIFL